MADPKRVFVFGAGFSNPAGMPLATEMLPLLIKKLKLKKHNEMREWLDDLRERVGWLSEHNAQQDPFKLNIEQVFHYGHFDIEAYRLMQHLVLVGREEGPETPWKQAESVKFSLLRLEEALRDVILKCDDKCDLASIVRWAKAVDPDDAVLTFNYDTLVERGLERDGKRWNHGMRREEPKGITVYKLHGSIDWIVTARREPHPEWDLIFGEEHENGCEVSAADDEDESQLLADDGRSGPVEVDCNLWRCPTRDRLRNWISHRHLQGFHCVARERTVGIAGLGAYKQLHLVPGLGEVWARGMHALYEADLAVVVGFSMSDFDTMAQLQFAEVARARARDGRPLRVKVIDPVKCKAAVEATKARFQRVFRCVEFIQKKHQDFDWSSLG